MKILGSHIFTAGPTPILWSHLYYAVAYCTVCRLLTTCLATDHYPANWQCLCSCALPFTVICAAVSGKGAMCLSVCKRVRRELPSQKRGKLPLVYHQQLLQVDATLAL
jgi:hypothetical protein